MVRHVLQFCYNISEQLALKALFARLVGRVKYKAIPLMRAPWTN
jgi:hypothetical protein